jgi:hypothetical protein
MYSNQVNVCSLCSGAFPFPTWKSAYARAQEISPGVENTVAELGEVSKGKYMRGFAPRVSKRVLTPTWDLDSDWNDVAEALVEPAVVFIPPGRDS